MNLFVVLKMVPDVVEELEVGPDGCSLDTEWLRMIVSECSEHALEQALLLKEANGGTVTVVALEAPEVDEALYTALAKGADHAIKLSVETFESRSPRQAALLAEALRGEAAALGPDGLILCGSQAIDDLEGEVGAHLAAQLALPYIGVVTNIGVAESVKKITVMKEFTGGVRGAFELALPAVVGIQSASSPPRYVPVAKIRAVMKTARIESREVQVPSLAHDPVVESLAKPEQVGRSRMLDGGIEEIAEQLTELIGQQGLV